MTVGIKDVAKLAGVSVATVSRALGDGPVSDALRERVAAAVKATGYTPNLSARRLRSQHTRTIGLVVADLRNPFFTAVGRAVEDAAYAAGMRVILCNTHENPEREAMYLGLMRDERVTGMILAPTRAALDRLDEKSFSFPVVLIDRAAGSRFDAVVLDNHEACAALVDHLAGRGYRRIGGLFGAASITGTERYEGYAAAMNRLGLPLEARFVPSTAEAATAAVTAWLTSAARPQALIVSNGLFLERALTAARAAGLAIPQDVALAGFDNETWTELVAPGMTVIEQPVDAIGSEAVAMLFDRLASPGRAIRKVVLSGCLIVRGSTSRETWPAAG